MVNVKNSSPTVSLAEDTAGARCAGHFIRIMYNQHKHPKTDLCILS